MSERAYVDIQPAIDAVCPFCCYHDHCGNIENPCAIRERLRERAADVAPVVRCKDCRYWKDRHIKQSDGTERQYKSTDGEYVDISMGINVEATCHYEDGRGWRNAKTVYRNAVDYCSRGEPRPCSYEQWWGIKDGAYPRPEQEGME